MGSTHTTSDDRPINFGGSHSPQYIHNNYGTVVQHNTIVVSGTVPTSQETGDQPEGKIRHILGALGAGITVLPAIMGLMSA